MHVVVGLENLEMRDDVEMMMLMQMMMTWRVMMVYAYVDHPSSTDQYVVDVLLHFHDVYAILYHVHLQHDMVLVHDVYYYVDVLLLVLVVVSILVDVISRMIQS